MRVLMPSFTKHCKQHFRYFLQPKSACSLMSILHCDIAFATYNSQCWERVASVRAESFHPNDASQVESFFYHDSSFFNTPRPMLSIR